MGAGGGATENKVCPGSLSVHGIAGLGVITLEIRMIKSTMIRARVNLAEAVMIPSSIVARMKQVLLVSRDNDDDDDGLILLLFI